MEGSIMPASSQGDAASASNLAAHARTESPAADPHLIADLVTANHILFDQHVVDAFGHVSVRHDKRLDRFLLARSMAPALVTATDILEFDLDGSPLAAAGRPVYSNGSSTAKSIACARTWAQSCTVIPTPSSRSAWCNHTSCARSST